DHASAPVQDREHQAFAEAVVLLALVAARKHAGLFQHPHPRIVGSERTLHRIPAARRPADAEAVDDRGVQSTLLAIRFRGRAFGQRALIERRRRIEQRVQIGVILARPPIAAFVRHGQADRLRQLLDCVGKFEALVFHQKAHSTAVRTATEAVVELLGRTDVERRRAFVVERAARRPFAARALQRHARLHHVDDVDAGQQFVDETFGDKAGHGFASLAFPALATGASVCPRITSRSCPAPWPTNRMRRHGIANTRAFGVRIEESMATFPFAQVSVFSTDPLGGNPLAVVHAAGGLADARMAAFARWTNLSETTFLLPPTDPEADYLVRIFTPGGELPFAGHPTLGSCHAWLAA